MNEKIGFKILSSLEKCFLDEQLSDKQSIDYLSMLKNEKLAFQVAYQLNDDGAETELVEIKAQGALAEYMSFSRVQSVPVTMPYSPTKYDDYLLRNTVGLYPDMLLPLSYRGKLKLFPKNLHSLWVELRLPEEEKSVEAGAYPITLTMLNAKGEAMAEAEIEIEIIAADLPETDFKRTEWFHCDCLANYYEVPVFGDKHFAIIEEFIKTAAENEINMLMMPVFTPELDTYIGGERLTCQLVDIYLNDGKYSFDFSKVDRWIMLCKKYNVSYYEIPHFFSQWGAEKTPKIMAFVDGKYKKLFGWETDALSEEYKTFLNAFIPALLTELKRHGVDKRTVFHISDEPHSEHLEHYKACKAVVEEKLEGYDIMDALSNARFFEEGVLDKSIISVSAADSFKPEDLKKLWVYYCGGDCVDVSNRSVSMPSERTRIIGIQMFSLGVKGFLHWGYNYYNNQYSYDDVNPFAECSGEYFGPAGDMFLVYPGKHGKPIPTIRLYLMRDAVQDYKALTLCAKLCGEEFTKRLISENLDYELNFKKYPHSPDYILNLRKKVNRAIKNAISVGQSD